MQKRKCIKIMNYSVKQQSSPFYYYFRLPKRTARTETGISRREILYPYCMERVSVKRVWVSVRCKLQSLFSNSNLSSIFERFGCSISNTSLLLKWEIHRLKYPCFILESKNICWCEKLIFGYLALAATIFLYMTNVHTYYLLRRWNWRKVFEKPNLKPRIQIPIKG